ncbi:MAG: hypothetical protein KatS3mg123_3265 [Burkholderiales bacterium]|nr:MAG: hypothetical protein KatS3mg123_3265 [Burkholderiales bacterium]
MSPRRPLPLVLTAALLVPWEAARPQAPSEGVRVYEPAHLVASRYTVVKRLWVESIPAMFRYPLFETREAAAAAARAAAAEAGVDGVAHLACTDLAAIGRGKGLLCYALAIRVKQP